MKKHFAFIFIFIFTIVSGGIAQNFPSSEDSVSILLCKKWELDYALMTGLKINKGSGTPDIFFEFKKDKTFLMTSPPDEHQRTGRWVCNLAKKEINLQTDDKSNMVIRSITPVELQVDMIPQNKKKKKAEGIQWVLKPEESR